MSTFEIKLEDFDGDRLDVDVEATAPEIRELFEEFDDEFEVTEPDEFVIDLTAVLDGATVALSGEVAGTFEYKCGRCLTERSLDVHSWLSLTVLPRQEWEETYVGEEEIGLAEEDLDTDYYEGESVDLRPFIRDAVLMELPQWPQCPDDLREECDEAYEEYVGDETLEQFDHNSVDLRWWPLRDIDLDDEEDNDDTDKN